MEQRVNLYLVMVCFNDTWVPIAQFVTCILLSCLLGFYYGLLGVLVGNNIEFIDLYLYVETLFFISMGI